MAHELNSLYYRIRMIPTKIIQRIRWWKYRLYGYDIDKTAQLERQLVLDRVNPKGIHIGCDTIITSGVTVFSHYLRSHIRIDKDGNMRTNYTGETCHTYIGKSCVIGIGSKIMGGVKIGDYCVVGAGSVVTKDVPDYTIVAGCPARIIRQNIDFDGMKI